MKVRVAVISYKIRCEANRNCHGFWTLRSGTSHLGDPLDTHRNIRASDLVRYEPLAPEIMRIATIVGSELDVETKIVNDTRWKDGDAESPIRKK